MISYKLSHLLAAGALLCVVPACSSSSDDDPNTPPPVPPTVTSSSPANNASNVSVDASIVASFSEAMNAATVGGTTFFVTTGPSADPVAGTVSYSDSNAVFLPDAPLTGGDMYTATITTGAESASTGVGLAADHVWSFEIAPPVPPTVASTSPEADAVDVALDADIVAVFSEPMSPGTLNGVTFFVTVGPSADPVAGAVSYSGSSALFASDVPLTAGETYTATVTTGAQSASTGTGLAADHVWSFETIPAVPPTVTSTSPVADAVGVPVNGNVTANFSEPMNAATLTDVTFILTIGTPPVLVPGTVIYDDSSAVFWPAEYLLAHETYTATVTTGAQSASTGLGLAADHVWSFETTNLTTPTLPVDLGTAGNFAILTKAGISTVPPSSILGDIGVSPAAATAITGFSLVMDASGVFSTSNQVTGQVFAADYTPPTPQNMTTAVSDMELAFTDAAGRAPDLTELFAGNIDIPFSFPTGVYKWGTGLTVNAPIILTGSATDVWIFQIAQDFILSNGMTIGLGGDARPENIFWQVSGLVNLGTTTTIHGTILTATAVTVNTGGTVIGRLLAQTAVTLDHATIVEPAPL